jgi:hypothetical protein
LKRASPQCETISCDLGDPKRCRRFTESMCVHEIVENTCPWLCHKCQTKTTTTPQLHKLTLNKEECLRNDSHQCLNLNSTLCDYEIIKTSCPWLCGICKTIPKLRQKKIHLKSGMNYQINDCDQGHDSIKCQMFDEKLCTNEIVNASCPWLCKRCQMGVDSLKNSYIRHCNETDSIHCSNFKVEMCKYNLINISCPHLCERCQSLLTTSEPTGSPFKFKDCNERDGLNCNFLDTSMCSNTLVNASCPFLCNRCQKKNEIEEDFNIEFKNCNQDDSLNCKYFGSVNCNSRIVNASCPRLCNRCNQIKQTTTTTTTTTTTITTTTTTTTTSGVFPSLENIKLCQRRDVLNDCSRFSYQMCNYKFINDSCPFLCQHCIDIDSSWIDPQNSNLNLKEFLLEEDDFTLTNNNQTSTQIPRTCQQKDDQLKCLNETIEKCEIKSINDSCPWLCNRCHQFNTTVTTTKLNTITPFEQIVQDSSCNKPDYFQCSRFSFKMCSYKTVHKICPWLCNKCS